MIEKGILGICKYLCSFNTHIIIYTVYKKKKKKKKKKQKKQLKKKKLQKQKQLW